MAAKTLKLVEYLIFLSYIAAFKIPTIAIIAALSHTALAVFLTVPFTFL